MLAFIIMRTSSGHYRLEDEYNGHRYAAFDSEREAIDAAVRIAQDLKARYRITYMGDAFAGQSRVVASSAAKGLDL